MFVLSAALTDPDDRDFMMDLYNGHYGLVRSSIHKVIWDTDHLEDLINDTFLKLIGKISILRTLDCCRLAAYVVYTSRSTSIDFIRSRDLQTKHMYFGLDEDLAGTVLDPAEALEDKVVYSEERDDLWRAILRLPEKQKDLLYFKYVLEMPDAEIAGILGIATASVRQYLTRARRGTKKLINEELKNHGEQSG
jgi:RNA polymerase sigma-70 factor, ECF subfamily